MRESFRKLRGYWAIHRMFHSIRKEVKADPNRANYTDLAISPMRGNEFESLDLYHATRGGEEALARKRRSDTIREHTDHEAASVAAE